MPDRFFNLRRGLAFGYNNCTQCAVRIPRSHEHPLCRCCAADTAGNPALSANTTGSSRLMAPAPSWEISGISRLPQIEKFALRQPDGSVCTASVWWLPKGSRWVAQHPLEYPRNRLKSLHGQDSDPAT
ncbi:hypothetical protein BH23ACT12_BH23ACT12_04300 [soil metagenome]